MITLRQLIAELPEDQRQRIKNHAREIIAEERFLQELRHALHETAAHLADELGIVPQDVPVLEHQADLLLTAFAGYVAAAGGRLQLVAELPGRPSITLTDVGAIFPQPELPPSDTPSNHAG